MTKASNKKELSARTAPVLLFLAAVLWSSAGLYAKVFNWNGFCLAAVRGLLSFAGFGTVLGWKRIRITKYKLLAAVCYFGQSVTLTIAYKYTAAGNASVLQNTSPVYIILLNMLILKKKPTRREVTVCCFLLAGLILTCLGSFSAGGGFGNFMGIVSGVLYGGVFFFNKCNGDEAYDALFLGSALYLLLIPVLLTNEAVRATPLKDWPVLIAFALGSGFLAWTCWATGMRGTSALTANYITMAEPVLNPVWTFLVLGETLTAPSLAGFAVVIVTLLIYGALEAKSPQPSAPPGGDAAT